MGNLWDNSVAYLSYFLRLIGMVWRIIKDWHVILTFLFSKSSLLWKNCKPCEQNTNFLISLQYQYNSKCHFMHPRSQCLTCNFYLLSDIHFGDEYMKFSLGFSYQSAEDWYHEWGENRKHRVAFKMFYYLTRCKLNTFGIVMSK